MTILRAMVAIFLCSCASAPPPANRSDELRVGTGDAGVDAEDVPRPATRTDCVFFIDRNVEVRLHELGVGDAEVIEKRKQELRATLADDIEHCVGRKITERAMRCVRGAQTSSEIDGCLR